MAKIKKLLLLLIFLIISSTLINNSLFGPATLSAYFGFILFACCMVAVAGIVYYQHLPQVTLANLHPLSIFTLLAGYYLLNGLVNNPHGGLNLRNYYMLINALLLFSYYIVIASGVISVASIYICITTLAGLESIVCLLQYNGTISSNDVFFVVTGTCVNPNVTAMFLAMAVPAIISVYNHTNKLKRLAVALVFAATAISIILLKCRTAYIGSIVVVILFCNQRYSLVQKLRRQKTWLLVVEAICIIVITAIAALLLYKSKQASSDGRAFIWKISWHTLTQKPWLGSGYGQFEHDYNLVQSAYFNQGLGSPSEIRNAAFVRMAYNEFLENIVEGGLVGLLLFVAFVCLLLFNYVKNNVAQLGILCFVVMGLFNFTIQALPVMAVFCIYIVANTKNRIDLNIKATTSWYKPTFTIPIWLPAVSSIAAIGLLMHLLPIARAYNRCKIINDNASKLSKTALINELEALHPQLYHSVFYWRSYGKHLYQNQQYKDALECMQHAIALSSHPDLYLALGTCYAKLTQYSEAAHYFTIASSIEPNKMTPQMELLKLYIMKNDTADILLQAKKIIAMQPKISSNKAIQYKKEAQNVIKMFANQ